MPPDRLDALRRQRALVAQHLAWLDSEIAAAGPTPAPIPPITPVAANATTADTLPVPTIAATPVQVSALGPQPTEDALAAANARADEIIAQHAATDRFDPHSTRRGCILLASAVFLLGLAGAMFAYLLYYNK